YVDRQLDQGIEQDRLLYAVRLPDHAHAYHAPGVVRLSPHVHADRAADEGYPRQAAGRHAASDERIPGDRGPDPASVPIEFPPGKRGAPPSRASPRLLSDPGVPG